MKSLLACFTLSVCLFAHADDQCESPKLGILLTNDDGVTMVGIQEMHRALNEAGHNVRRIAPNQNYSGSGASLTLRGVSVEDISSDEFPNVYAVSGSPATSVIIGASAIFQPDDKLDIIVSGINDGANIGAAPTVSGTIGAILTGLNMLHPSVPGIAISTNPTNDDAESPEYQEHFANVAEFVANLIDIIGCDDQWLVSGQQALHINYPPMSPKSIKGVRLAEQGRLSQPWLGYAETSDGTYTIRRLNESAAESAIADSTLFHNGYITIVPIDGSYAAEPKFDTAEVLSVKPRE